MDARGRITTREGGGLEKATFERVVAGDWLNAAVTLTGRGRGALDVALTGGSLDMRRMPDTGGDAGGGGPIDVRLDRLRISEGISLTDFRGEFGSRGGFNGRFVAAVNDMR